MLNALEQIKRWSVYLTIFLVPLFFLPWSFEALEWNKQYLLYFLVMLGLLAWLAKMMIEKRLEFHRTPLDLPILGFWFIVLISSLASAARTQSMLGALNNISFGFVPLTFYTLFYFLATNTLYDTAKIKRAINFLAYSGVVAVLFFFLYVFGFWRLIKVNFAFSNTISSLSTIFGVYLILVMCRGLYGLLLKKNGAGESVFSGIVALLSLAALVMVGFKLVWVMTAIALFVLLVFAMTHIEEMRSVWISAVFGIFVVSLIFILLGVPSFTVAQLPLEVSLSAGSTGISPPTPWVLASKILFSVRVRRLLCMILPNSGPKI